MSLLDRQSVLRHRLRHAQKGKRADRLFLTAWALQILCERLRDFTPNFAYVLVIGAYEGLCHEYLQPLCREKGKIGRAVFLDSDVILTGSKGCCVVADDAALPFRKQSFDAILSVCMVHRLNAIAPVFVKMRHMLTPGGMLLGCCPGGETLLALGRAFLQAEAKLGVASLPHMVPRLTLLDIARFLQTAGFVSPVADRERLSVKSATVFHMLRDIQGMGESNSLQARAKGMGRKNVFLETMRLYEAENRNSEGSIRTDYEILFFHGWAARA